MFPAELNDIIPGACLLRFCQFLRAGGFESQRGTENSKKRLEKIVVIVHIVLILCVF